MLLGLERGGRKGVGKGQWWVLIKTNVCGWSYWSIGGGLTQACASPARHSKILTALPSKHYSWQWHAAEEGVTQERSSGERHYYRHSHTERHYYCCCHRQCHELEKTLRSLNNEKYKNYDSVTCQTLQSSIKTCLHSSFQWWTAGFRYSCRRMDVKYRTQLDRDNCSAGHDKVCQVKVK